LAAIKPWRQAGRHARRARRAVGASMALPDRLASRPICLASSAGDALADVALPNNGFGTHCAFPAFRGEEAGDAKGRVLSWQRRRRGFLRRLSKNRASGEPFRSLTAKP